MPGGDLDLEVRAVALPSDEFVDEATWNRLAQQHGAAFSQGSAWLAAWWRHYGHGRRPRTFVFRRDGVPVAFVPTFIEDVGAGPLRLTVAKLAGCDHSPFPRAVLAAAPEDRAAVLEAVVHHLVEDEGCSVVSLGPFRSDEATDGTLADPDSITTRRATEAPGVGMWLDTSGGDAHYTRRMSAATRKSLRRRSQSLRSTPGFVMERVPDDELAAEFARFHELHQHQWEAAGQQGHFADWPDATAFHAEVVAELAATGDVHLYRATADGEPVAYEYMVRFGDHAFSLLAARSLDPRWVKASVGTVLLHYAAACEADDGAVEVDLGRGHYDYKASQGAMSAELVRLRFVHGHLRTKCAAVTWFAIAKLSHLAYYRLWFGTARPALRLPAKALARWFIKFQL